MRLRLAAKVASALQHTFLYPMFGAGGPNIDALVKYIYQSLIPFCLPRGEVKKTTEMAWATKDANAIIALGDRARCSFGRVAPR